MFNFTIKWQIDDMGAWCTVETDAVVYYVAWYPDDKEPLISSIWGNYGF